MWCGVSLKIVLFLVVGQWHSIRQMARDLFLMVRGRGMSHICTCYYVLVFGFISLPFCLFPATAANTSCAQLHSHSLRFRNYTSHTLRNGTNGRHSPFLLLPPPSVAIDCGLFSPPSTTRSSPSLLGRQKQGRPQIVSLIALVCRGIQQTGDGREQKSEISYAQLP